MNRQRLLVPAFAAALSLLLASAALAATAVVGPTTAHVAPPTDTDQCKNGGWQTFTDPSFRNQGECVSFVASGGKSGGTASEGSWSLFGGATGEESDGQPAPSVKLRSDATAAFSGAAFSPKRPLTFDQIESLGTDFRVVTGDCGAGSPRFQVGVDMDGDGDFDKNVFVYLGPFPNFSGCGVSWQSSGNLVQASDARWDTSQIAPGTQYNTHAGASALVGSKTVTGVQIVVDSSFAFPASGQAILVDNVEVNGNTLRGP